MLKKTRLRRTRPLSRLARRKADSGSTYWLKKADDLWREYLHGSHSACAAQAEGSATGDGCSGHLEAHHIISRSVRHLRHHTINGMVLCSYHHKWSSKLSPHGGPAGFFAWMKREQPERYAWLVREQWRREPIDYEAAARRLAAMMSRDAP